MGQIAGLGKYIMMDLIDTYLTIVLPFGDRRPVICGNEEWRSGPTTITLGEVVLIV